MPVPLPTTPALPGGPSLAALLARRQTVLPKRLGPPGPDAAQLQAILEAARHAPDHGCLLPWRFVLVPAHGRAALAEAFAQALRERDPAAGPQDEARAREKAHRAPVLLLVAVDEAGGDPGIPPAERVLSAGCAVQNVLLMATALGYDSALTSGQALGAPALRGLFALAEGERALCFISLGTAQARKPARERPALACYAACLAPGGGVQPWGPPTDAAAQTNDPATDAMKGEEP